MKTVGGFRRTRYRGLDRTGLAGNLVATAYNLVRMAKLLGQAAATPEARMALPDNGPAGASYAWCPQGGRSAKPKGPQTRFDGHFRRNLVT